MPAQDDLDLSCIRTIQTLSMDGVQAANSGHPGTPMAMAPVAYTIWQEFLRFDPEDPIWPNRDRFVLSIGHASMLLYSLLHLTGVKSVDKDYERLGEPSVTLEDLKKFRQLDSKCPGHPEYRWTSGVETTTGPLGQGVATSVGMASAGKWLAAHYNKPGFDLFDFDVYALCGDGDMMEGVSSEAASLAGHLKLSNLCWIYDSNRITIDGSTSITFTEDTAARFRAYGWNVLEVADATDTEAIAKALQTFKETHDRPTFIVVHSHIGWGSSRQDSAKAHGAPLGDDVILAWKEKYASSTEKFFVPDGVYDHFEAGIGKRGKALRDAWFSKIDEYKAKYPTEAQQLYQMQHRQLPDGWDKDLPTFPADPKGLAGRAASAKILNAIAPNVPWLIGGSADLNESTKTEITAKDAGSFEPDNYGGRNFHFGIREHAMAAFVNGMSLVKVRPYGAGFFIFSDYARPSIRLSAIMEIPTIHIFTHDSIGVGEDGPTHQPIEQLPSLRAIPGLVVLRPADANECVEAWKVVMKLRHEPALLVLTRQDLPTLDRTKYASAAGVAKGAYILADAEDGKPDVLLMGSGSEVSLCVAAYESLKAEGIKARVISMPSWDIFEHQPEEYQESVIPHDVHARVYVEQASTFGWEKYTGKTGAKIGMHTFGASAPLKALQSKFGFSPEKVAEAAKDQLKLVAAGRNGKVISAPK
ncbi:transketolase [Tundrisphaera lichenicola]|uniref:transketolase n=1 Tax=Tundrisphaera lichenicola TaxID=2029860 RepID=UPI003EB99EAF